MNRYDTNEILKMLDTVTVGGLLRLYGLTYRHLAIKLNCTRPNISYHMKHNSFREFERLQIYEVLQQHGLQETELVLFHTILKIRRETI